MLATLTKSLRWLQCVRLTLESNQPLMTSESNWLLMTLERAHQANAIPCCFYWIWTAVKTCDINSNFYYCSSSTSDSCYFQHCCDTKINCDSCTRACFNTSSNTHVGPHHSEHSKTKVKEGACRQSAQGGAPPNTEDVEGEDKDRAGQWDGRARQGEWVVRIETSEGEAEQRAAWNPSHQVGLPSQKTLPLHELLSFFGWLMSKLQESLCCMESWSDFLDDLWYCKPNKKHLCTLLYVEWNIFKSIYLQLSPWIPFPQPVVLLLLLGGFVQNCYLNVCLHHGHRHQDHIHPGFDHGECRWGYAGWQQPGLFKLCSISLSWRLGKEWGNDSSLFQFSSLCRLCRGQRLLDWSVPHGHSWWGWRRASGKSGLVDMLSLQPLQTPLGAQSRLLFQRCAKLVHCVRTLASQQSSLREGSGDLPPAWHWLPRTACCTSSPVRHWQVEFLLE